MPGGVGPNAASPLKTIKWTNEQFADAAEGRLPIGEPTEQWSYGDLDAGFKSAALVLDETFVVQSTGHHPMETRRRWRTGRTASCHPLLDAERRADGTGDRALVRHRADGRRADQRVHRRRFRQQRAAARSRCRFPALLSKKANAPVLMRHHPRRRKLYRPRADEHDRPDAHRLREGRPHPRARSLHRPGQRIVWADGRPPVRRGLAASIIYQPQAMRWRAISVLTNTPPRSQQRSPGPMQANGMIEPLIHQGGQAARRRSSRDPQNQLASGTCDVRSGTVRNGQRQRLTSAFINEALDKGKATFRWDERKAYSGQRPDRRCAASASR
jgi:xanthine dehydrogenase molybdenum-binding subunit